MDGESIRVLLTVVGFGAFIIGFKAIAKFRKRYLSVTGDEVDGTVVDSSYRQNSIQEVSQGMNYYHLTVKYKHKGTLMTNKMKVAEDEMARFYPDVVRTKQFPLNKNIPIRVNPKKPKRIAMDTAKLMYQVYPEFFGFGSNDKNPNENLNDNPYA